MYTIWLNSYVKLLKTVYIRQYIGGGVNAIPYKDKGGFQETRQNISQRREAWVRDRCRLDER